MSDYALREAASRREPPEGWLGSSPAGTPDGREFWCPHCGRYWAVLGEHGRAAGFVRSAANNHVSICALATPEERRAIARIDEKRWRKNPPSNFVKNDWSHFGYRD